MTKKEFVKIYKRFLIAFVCCLPFFILIGIFLTNKIGNVWSVVLYVVIGAIAFVLAEIIHKKRLEKLEVKKKNAKIKRRMRELGLDDSDYETITAMQKAELSKENKPKNKSKKQQQ